MIRFLERRYYKQEGGNKYHINCDKLQKKILMILIFQKLYNIKIMYLFYMEY